MLPFTMEASAERRVPGKSQSRVPGKSQGGGAPFEVKEISEGG
jgi:hypothetical protein